jgi:hypothetical protein
MPKEKNNGSWLEGLTTVIGGLMKQDTNGDIDHLTKTITNEKDGGIDYERSVDSNVDYFEYVRTLKKKEK